MKRRFALLATLALLDAVPAAAVDYSLSGYGTVGYARSNQPYAYQRFIDDDGTIKRDSVVGAQVDVRFNSEFSATVQAKLAADAGSDRRYEANVPWAFVSWRPTNDWLIRVGKQRIPLYLYSETVDVGTTYDFARLPVEMYSLVPSNDQIGASFGKSWRLGHGEFSLDGYAGISHNDVRYWSRDSIPGVQDTGPSYRKLDFHGGGVIATYRVDDDTFRIGLHRAIIRASDRSPLPTTFPFVPIAPGIGYYQVSPALPGPGPGTISSVTNTAFVAGAQVALPVDAAVVGEFARSIVRHVDTAPQGNRGYLAVLKHVGNWTPYVSYAFLRSPKAQRDYYTRLNDNTVPAFIPGAALLNASQRAGADLLLVYDQSSWAFGTAYSFSATSKLKAEFLRTHVGSVSQLIDSPPGDTIRDRSINVFSLSYSVVY